MAQAKSKDEYVREWTRHINQLVYPALDAGIDYGVFTDTKARLVEWVEQAAEKTFPKESECETVNQRTTCQADRCR